MTKTSISVLLCVSVFAIGCVEDDEGEDEGDLATVAQEIQNGDPAVSWQWQRSVLFNNCTGTLIAPRYVLTAAHCEPTFNESVVFYTSINPDGDSRLANGTWYPSGVAPWNDDLTDSSGNWADIAVVKLDVAAPTTSVVANLAWIYPTGGDDQGRKVGAGQHDGNGALFGELRQILDITYTPTDADGYFWTEHEQTNSGDSGGAFFHGSYSAAKLLGTLFGDVYDWDDAKWRNQYTSVPYHLDWILTRIGYVWPGDPQNTQTRRTGTVHSAFVATKKICQYACDRSSCVAYNHSLQQPWGQCTLLSSVTGSVFDLYGTSALK